MRYIKEEQSTSEIVHDETDLAEKRLNEAMAQRKKELQQLKNIMGRQMKQKNKEDRIRITLFKESFKGKKEVPKRNKPWKTIEWQNYWNSLGNHEQNNLDRKKSHCHKSIYTKIEEMAENFNASVVCLIRYPNGTQHTKYVLASGGGIQFAQSEDGILIDQLWVRHWNKKQEKRQKLCEEKGIWQERASKREKRGLKKVIVQDNESLLHDDPMQRNSFEKGAHKRKKTAKKKGIHQEKENESELHDNPNQRNFIEKGASKRNRTAKKKTIEHENESVLLENHEQKNSIERGRKSIMLINLAIISA
ncbi:hypothetical protein DAPPUDRAFT_336376 [Daphnia pulex]|uniref:Uncharacterized protein n=1 Tax=Daphnia pulex TaxID=6669 RepID=E9HZK1_DAPPU|nr:hypothetical protein DAPPUDRAFT_336376 [Daphnia pulex]|eukprot:EFX62829.1 hypothetical protein DAPPUDRAFT_336376 [Daphnia pulex]